MMTSALTVSDVIYILVQTPIMRTQSCLSAQHPTSKYFLSAEGIWGCVWSEERHKETAQLRELWTPGCCATSDENLELASALQTS